MNTQQIKSFVSSDNFRSRLANGLRYVKAGRHYIKPCAILTIVILAYTVEFLFLLTEKLHTATVWSIQTLLENTMDYSTLPQEEEEEEPDTLQDDTVQKLRELSIRELKKVASMQKLPRYGNLSKSELVEALIAQQ